MTFTFHERNRISLGGLIFYNKKMQPHKYLTQIHFVLSRIAVYIRHIIFIDLDCVRPFKRREHGFALGKYPRGYR